MHDIETEGVNRVNCINNLPDLEKITIILLIYGIL